MNINSGNIFKEIISGSINSSFDFRGFEINRSVEIHSDPALNNCPVINKKSVKNLMIFPTDLKIFLDKFKILLFQDQILVFL